MNFYELNKKMNNSEYQCNEAEVTLKAHGGDRAKNLYGIADAIDNQIKTLNHALNTIPLDADIRGEYYLLGVLHKLKGYANQLRLIADELDSEREAERERGRRGFGGEPGAHNPAHGDYRHPSTM